MFWLKKDFWFYTVATAAGRVLLAGVMLSVWFLTLWILPLNIEAQNYEKGDEAQNNFSPQSVRNFSNVTPLNIPNIGGVSSSITVSGVNGSISKLTVTLNGIVHLTPADLDVLLIGPGGQQLVIMSDAGGNFPLTDSIVRLSDFNANRIPANSSIGNGLVDYKPTNYGSFDTFTGISGFPPSVAPGGFETLSSTFDNIDPNGTWTLIVQDDTSRGNGANSRVARGWSIQIETPETLIVNTTDDIDDGFCTASHCSLREAIKYSTNGSEIKFANTFGGRTIVLGGNQLEVDKRLTISALDFNGQMVFVSGNLQDRVFLVSPNGDLTLNNIGVSGGSRLASGNFGGGIFNDRGTLTLNSCIIRGNKAADGDGIASSGILRMTTSIVENNDTDLTADGGGIYLQKVAGIPQETTIFSSIIRNNDVFHGKGSGIYLGDGTKATIMDSAIHDNTSLDNSTIFLDGGDLTLTNTTVARNRSLPGIAIIASGSTTSKLLAVNSTIADNQTFIDIRSSGANFVLKNSIAAVVNGVVSQGNNLFNQISSTTPQPTDIVSANLGLGTFGFNGGLVPTIPLLSSSPAINAGSDCVMLAANNGGCSPVQIFEDARFLPRDLGGGVDIGATEFNLLPPGSLLPNGRRALPSAATGRNYSQDISTSFSGGTSTIAVSGFNIPGLTVTESLVSAGVLTISGIPTAPGTYNFAVTVNNTAGFSVSGNYTLVVSAPTAATVSIGGRVLSPDGRGLARAFVTFTDVDGNVHSCLTNSFGYYRFTELQAGETYIFTVKNKNYEFTPQAVMVTTEREDLNFVGTELQP